MYKVANKRFICYGRSSIFLRFLLYILQTLTKTKYEINIKNTNRNLVHSIKTNIKTSRFNRIEYIDILDMIKVYDFTILILEDIDLNINL